MPLGVTNVEAFYDMLHIGTANDHLSAFGKRSAATVFLLSCRPNSRLPDSPHAFVLDAHSLFPPTAA
jgi:hypothetical protein